MKLKGLGVILWAMLLCLLVAPPIFWIIVVFIVGIAIYGGIAAIKKMNENK